MPFIPTQFMYSKCFHTVVYISSQEGLQRFSNYPPSAGISSSTLSIHPSSVLNISNNKLLSGLQDSPFHIVQLLKRSYVELKSPSFILPIILQQRRNSDPISMYKSLDIRKFLSCLLDLFRLNILSSVGHFFVPKVSRVFTILGRLSLLNLSSKIPPSELSTAFLMDEI